MVRKKVTLKKDKNGVKSVFFLGNWEPNSFRLHVRIYSNKRCANFVFRQLFEKMAKKPLFPSKTPKKTSFSVINRKGSLNRKKIIRSFLRKRQFWRLKPKFLSCGSSCLVTIGKINLKNWKWLFFWKNYFGGEFFFFFLLFLELGVGHQGRKVHLSYAGVHFQFWQISIQPRSVQSRKLVSGLLFFSRRISKKKKIDRWDRPLATSTQNFSLLAPIGPSEILVLYRLESFPILGLGMWLTLHTPGFYCLTGLALLARIRGAGRFGTLTAPHRPL